MSKPNPYCSKCSGRGWYEGPYYGHLKPTIEKLVCPECNVLSKPTTAEVVFLGFAFIALFTLMILGAM